VTLDRDGIVHADREGARRAGGGLRPRTRKVRWGMLHVSSRAAAITRAFPDWDA